jgi:hypothetical protein
MKEHVLVTVLESPSPSARYHIHLQWPLTRQDYYRSNLPQCCWHHRRYHPLLLHRQGHYRRLRLPVLHC